MRRYCLLLSALAGLGPVGCISWRQQEPQHPACLPATEPSPSAHLATPTGQTASAETTAPASVPTVRVESASAALPSEGPRVEPTADPLTLVAEALDRGENATAAAHLESYVRTHPEQVMFRLQLAELLVQTRNDAKAKVHYEQFLVQAQNAAEPIRKYRVHVHTRLMEIGQRGNDPYAERFHRGVGLLSLLQEQDKNPDRDDEFCEEMLCKALRALNEAGELKPGDPRVRVYLAEVYERMGNRRRAATERRAAHLVIVPGGLNPGEQASVLIRGL